MFLIERPRINPFSHWRIFERIARELDLIEGLLGPENPVPEPDHRNVHVHVCGLFGGSNQFGWWTDPIVTENYPNALPHYGVTDNTYPHYTPIGHMLPVSPVITPIPAGENSGIGYYLDGRGNKVYVNSTWGFFQENEFPFTGRLLDTLFNSSAIAGVNGQLPQFFITTNGHESDNSNGAQGKYVDFLGIVICHECPNEPGTTVGAVQGGATMNDSVVMVHEGGWDWGQDSEGSIIYPVVYCWHADVNPVFLCGLPSGCENPPPFEAPRGVVPARPENRMLF